MIAHDKVATAWSLADGSEKWTVDLPVSRGQRPTSLGGGVTIQCEVGRIEQGIVKLPAIGGAPIPIRLEDGKPAAPPDGGRKH